MIIHINNVCMLLIWNILACESVTYIYIDGRLLNISVVCFSCIHIYYMIIIIPYHIKYCSYSNIIVIHYEKYTISIS